MLDDWPSHSRQSHTVSTSDIRSAIKAYKAEKKEKKKYRANADAVNSNKPNSSFSNCSVKKYLYEKDDCNVSTTGSTPLKKGLRGCQHCGSKNHFDKECKQPARFPNVKAATAKVHFANSDGHKFTDQDLMGNDSAEPEEEELPNEESDTSSDSSSSDSESDSDF